MTRPPAPTRSRHALFAILTLAIVAVLVELCAGLATTRLVRSGYMASLPRLSEAQITEYFARRDPHLGWGPTDAGGTMPDAPCASAYGDSFTLGWEVAADASYPHVLGTLLGCGVANYGVVGYGSDQALMRFRTERERDRAPIVILGHLAENVLRDVNQYRVLLYPGAALLLKPRFVLVDGVPTYVPPPVNDPEELRDLPDHPERYLRHEAFLGRARRERPYAWSLLRWLGGDFHLHTWWQGLPRHAPFYAPDHPSGALQVTAAILTTFVAEARAANRKPWVLLIPTGRDLELAQQTGQWTYDPLVDVLRERGTPIIHPGPRFLERLAGDDPCTLFQTYDCRQHLNETGYRWLADAVYEAVRDSAHATGSGH